MMGWCDEPDVVVCGGTATPTATTTEIATSNETTTEIATSNETTTETATCGNGHDFDCSAFVDGM